MRTTAGGSGLRVAAAVWIVAGGWYLVTEAVVAQRLSGYSYAADYISDLGQPVRSPMAAWMNAAFIVQGVAFALAAGLVVAAVRLSPGAVAFLGLALIYGAGSATVGLVPSGGSGTYALVHVGGAIAAIVAGNLAILTAGGVLLHRRLRAVGFAGVTLGAAGLISGALLLYSGSLGARVVLGAGAWERGAIYTIIGWQLLAGIGALAFRQPLRATDPARPCLVSLETRPGVLPGEGPPTLKVVKPQPQEAPLSEHEVKMIILSTDDLDESIRFYCENLGMTLKFRDGAHFAALDGGPVTLALATAVDHPIPGQVVVGIKTADVDAAAKAVEASGGGIVRAAYDDAHERRAVVFDNKGNGLVFYSPLTR